MRRLVGLLLLAGLSSPLTATEWLDKGHLKARLNSTWYPDDSLFTTVVDDPAFDQGADARLNFVHRGSHWSATADYQLIVQSGDSLELADLLPNLSGPNDVVQNDDRRALDLTHEITDNSDNVVIQRLDRLHGEWRANKWVVRAGRQAVSWGNGLIYTPMDVFNPFDPAAVDTEYKAGDDMVYGQYLLDNGDDWQAVWIVRRDDDKNLDREVNSFALKYHGFLGEQEYDILVSEHYDDLLLGLGGSTPWGGAVLRADLTLTDTDNDTVWSAVASWSYSWLGWGRNMSGVVEYYYNGFGEDDEDYAPASIQENEDLFVRLARGELYTLARNYLAASVLVEVTPLLQVTPNVFYNLYDNSALFQLVGQYDVAQDWQILGSLYLPVGSSDTEFGGFDSGIEDFEVSYGASVFAQLAWYF